MRDSLTCNLRAKSRKLGCSLSNAAGGRRPSAGSIYAPVITDEVHLVLELALEPEELKAALAGGIIEQETPAYGPVAYLLTASYLLEKYVGQCQIKRSSLLATWDPPLRMRAEPSLVFKFYLSIPLEPGQKELFQRADSESISQVKDVLLSVRAATPQASLKKLQDIVKKNVARSPTTTLLSQQEFLPLLPDALTASVLSHCSAMTPMGNEPDLGLVEFWCPAEMFPKLQAVHLRLSPTTAFWAVAGVMVSEFLQCSTMGVCLVKLSAEIVAGWHQSLQDEARLSGQALRSNQRRELLDRIGRLKRKLQDYQETLQRIQSMDHSDAIPDDAGPPVRARISDSLAGLPSDSDDCAAGSSG